MAYGDIRGWLKAVDGIDPPTVIEGAHWDLEIGAITKISQFKAKEGFPGKMRYPALLFDDIIGYPRGYRLLVNPLDSVDRMALTVGLPLHLSPTEFVAAWKEKLKNLKSMAPRKVKDGPVLENVHLGQDINVLEFPVPRWHEGDGGRYIGTAGVTVSKDPDEGWVNLGTYRVMVHDDKSLGLYSALGRHGRIHREKCFQTGEPWKVALVVGHDPLLALAGSQPVAWGFSEYDFVGGIKGQPLEVIEGPMTGLPIPADAEIVIEGEALPGETKMEGPFGEWTGYYGSSARPEPLVKVKSVLHRDNPILLGMPPVRGSQLFRMFLGPAEIWNELEKAGVPDVKGVWCSEAAGAHLILVVSIKQRYPGHARQAGLVASGCHSGACLGRYVIVVDDDIDPANSQDVLWALGTRSDPERSIEIIRRCWSTALDPAIPREHWGLNSRTIIDACRPYEWIGEFPPVVGLSKELEERTLRKWSGILFGTEEA